MFSSVVLALPGFLPISVHPLSYVRSAWTSLPLAHCSLYYCASHSLTADIEAFPGFWFPKSLHLNRAFVVCMTSALTANIGARLHFMKVSRSLSLYT
jgi:hypothetical protein